MRKFFTAIFFVFCFQIIHAQVNFEPGFIINNEGDTIKGLVDSRGYIKNSKVCNFKDLSEENSFEYEPGEIQAFGFTNGKFYVSREIVIDEDTSTVFLEYLVDGIMDIYYLRNLENDYYFAQKDDRLVLLDNQTIIIGETGHQYYKESNKYIGILKYYTGDYPEMGKKVEKAKLTHESLINIASDYHAYICEGEDCIIYEKELPKFKIIVSPIIGLDFNKIKINNKEVMGYYNANPDEKPENILVSSGEEVILKSNLNYSIGVNFSTNLYFTSEHLYFDLQVRYGNYYYREYTENDNEAVLIYSKGDNLMNNATFKYVFPYKIKPYIGIGASYYFTVNKSEITKYAGAFLDTDEDGLRRVASDFEEIDILRSHYMGYSIGVGVEIPVMKKYSIVPAIQYNYMWDNFNLNQFNIRTFSFVIGIQLNK
jgi:hypothetical protein